MAEICPDDLFCYIRPRLKCPEITKITKIVKKVVPRWFQRGFPKGGLKRPVSNFSESSAVSEGFQMDSTGLSGRVFCLSAAVGVK